MVLGVPYNLNRWSEDIGVPHNLNRWSEDIKRDHGREIRKLFGFGTFLIYVAPDRYLVKALLKFWNPKRMFFTFKDFELKPTI